MILNRHKFIGGVLACAVVVAVLVAFDARADVRPEVVVRVVPNAVGVPQIRVNGQVVRPRMFWCWKGAAVASQIRLAASNGVDFVTFMVDKAAWRGENDYDWTVLDAQCDAILAVNPKALLVPRIKLETSGWWAEKYPAETVTYGDGTKAPVPSVSSRPYRRQARAFLAALARHLRARHPDHFAGLHPAAQSTSEFFYWNSWSNPYCGYDPATQTAFDDWRKAHGRAPAPVPTLAMRRLDAATSPTLADPVKDEVLVDFRRFQQAEMADFLADVCGTVRKATDGKKLVLGFYGYAWTFSRMSNGAAASGHYGLQRLLDRAAKDIDILCSPVDYRDRGVGGTGQAMSAAETVTRHGVLWLMEDDTRTYRVARNACMGCDVICKTPLESKRVLQRNLAQHILRGLGSWWMDLGSAGWYDDPELWTVMSNLENLDREFLDRKVPYAPDVAAIVDEDSMMFLSLGRVAGDVVGMFRLPLARGGAPFGQYLLSDVLRRPLAARLQFFQSAWYLTETQREQLRAQRAARPDVTRVWSWAAGSLAPQGKDLGGVARLTGFTAKPLAPTRGDVRATAEGLRRGLPAQWKSGQRMAYVDLIGVEATEAETWARFEDGTPAVAARATGKGGYEVFLGSPTCPMELVRALVDLAGVHRYVRSGDAGVWAAEGVLSVTAGQSGGEVVLDTGKPGPVTDALTGRQIGTGPAVALKMAPGENRIFRK